MEISNPYEEKKLTDSEKKELRRLEELLLNIPIGKTKAGRMLESCTADEICNAVIYADQPTPFAL